MLKSGFIYKGMNRIVVLESGLSTIGSKNLKLINVIEIDLLWSNFRSWVFLQQFFIPNLLSFRTSVIHPGLLVNLIYQKSPIFKCNVKKHLFESTLILTDPFLEWSSAKAIFPTQTVFIYKLEVEPHLQSLKSRITSVV